MKDLKIVGMLDRFPCGDLLFTSKVEQFALNSAETWMRIDAVVDVLEDAGFDGKAVRIALDDAQIFAVHGKGALDELRRVRDLHETPMTPERMKSEFGIVFKPLTGPVEAPGYELVQVGVEDDGKFTFGIKCLACGDTSEPYMTRDGYDEMISHRFREEHGRRCW